MTLFKRLAGLLFASLLAGCAADLKPAGPPVAAPAFDHDAWQAADGVRLPMRSWLPAGSPKAVILAVHGMNDYSHAFDGPGSFLAHHGIAVYAYDQRGFGKGPHPGYWSDGADMATDLLTAARLVAARHPGKPLYLLGESMGGAVAMLATAGDRPPPEVAGVILSAPAVWGRAEMGLVQRAALWLAYEVAPGWELTGRGLHITASDNIEMLRELSRDPLVIKATRVDAIHGLVDLMDDAFAVAPRLKLPALVLYGAKDEVIPPNPTWDMITGLPGLGRTQKVAYYDHGYHMLLRDLQAERVLADIAAWINDPAAPLPSGADQRAGAEIKKRAGG
jgi:alpha-beta hydrolase superfamily lysophospholipase